MKLKAFPSLISPKILRKTDGIIRGGEVTDQVDPFLAVDPDCILYHAYWYGVVSDHSGYGNNGTLTLGSGYFGSQGLTFDGSVTKVVIPMIYGDTGLSILLAVKVNTGDQMYVVINEGPPGQYPVYSFFFVAGFAMFVWRDTEGTTHFQDTSFSSPSPGIWNIIGVKFNFAANSGKFFLNGVFQAFNFDGPLGKSPAVNGVGCAIGVFPSSGLYHMNATVGEIFFDQVEVADSIFTARYNAIKDRYEL